MSKIVFVPLSDEILYDRPDMITGPITTYRPAISNNKNRSLSSKEPCQSSGAYLKGDLVNGLDVVYAVDKSTKKELTRKNTAV